MLQFPFAYENTIDRALVPVLEDWIAKGTVPPPSQYPSVAAGTLAPPTNQTAVGFPDPVRCRGPRASVRGRGGRDTEGDNWRKSPL